MAEQKKPDAAGTQQNQKANEKVLAALNTLSPAQIINDPRVKNKFITLYEQMHGAGRGAALYEAEKFYFGKLLVDTPELTKCTPMSLYTVFVNCAVLGLTVNPAEKLCYVYPQAVNIGTKDSPKYETRATLSIDGRGELLMRQRTGQISDYYPVVVVYDCDTFKHGLDPVTKHQTVLQHDIVTPRPENAKVIASYIRYEKASGEAIFKVYDRADMERFRSSSKSPNGPAWTKNYIGMVENKTIKHTFKNMPKLALKTQFTELATETEGTTEDINYEIDEDGVIVSQSSNDFDEPPVGETKIVNPETEEKGF